jgi:hypothetical protein
LRCPQDTGALTVPRLSETEMKVATILDQRGRKVEATIDVRTVSG